MLPMSLEGHEKRLSRLEEKERHIDGRFQNLHKKIDDNKKALEKDIGKISEGMEEIRKGQHSQELVNQKMTFTLDSINQERERDKEEKAERKREYKKIVGVGYSIVAAILGSLGWTLVRLWLGI